VKDKLEKLISKVINTVQTLNISAFSSLNLEFIDEINEDSFKRLTPKLQSQISWVNEGLKLYKEINKEKINEDEEIISEEKDKYDTSNLNQDKDSNHSPLKLNLDGSSRGNLGMKSILPESCFSFKITENYNTLQVPFNLTNKRKLSRKDSLHSD